MTTLIIALLSGVGFIVAYHTYGRWLARKIFNLNPKAVTPAYEMEDGVDFVPTRRYVVFGHHFTSIAGTGPIVGPAIAVFWGWLPALLWVVFGSIFIGAVHDFGSLVVSMRSRGQTVGDVAGRYINKRARILFLFILFFALMVVIGIFGLVIAVLFSRYPESVLSVWVAMPVAVVFGYLSYKRGMNLTFLSIVGLIILYVAVWVGVDYLPIKVSDTVFAGADATLVQSLGSSVVIWTLLLLVYCFFASILPVWLLLQPRDYINSNQLWVALGLLLLGMAVAHPEMVAPAFNSNPPADAPPIWPFLFVTIACGAISGFHCLVSSGTSSKQIKNEKDAQFIAYGSMLTEGALAVLVIIACCAGLGMGREIGGQFFEGAAAWRQYYGGTWENMRLPQLVGAFVDGGANLIDSLGIPHKYGVGIVAVMVCCFAATTLDTATRLQRYVVQEMGRSINIKPLENKYVATTVAVITGGALALISGPSGPGSGGLILWPLFGATNQLLAGLAFLVVAFFLIRHNKPVWFVIIPMILMIIIPAWALFLQIKGWIGVKNWMLAIIGGLVLALQIWMVIEALIMWRKARGVMPEPLPALKSTLATANPGADGGRSC